MHKVHVYAVGGDYADNGVDQLIIDGEAMPVLKALIKEGKTPGVREGAVRLLTRLCTTLEARQEVRSASSPYNMFPDCLASVLPLCCITVLLPEVVIEPDVIKEIQAPMHKRRHVQGHEFHPFASHYASSRPDICCKPLLYSVLHYI